MIEGGDWGLLGVIKVIKVIEVIKVICSIRPTASSRRTNYIRGCVKRVENADLGFLCQLLFFAPGLLSA
jgi:hypothetical protein